MKPLISVIIPTYNCASTIETAISSMLQQTYENIEIIVVDDNSTDETEAITRNMARQYPRVSYYRLPFDDPHRFNRAGRNINAGYMARNYGFEKARGEWITFQDADDASLLNRLEIQHELAERHQVLHVITDWQELNEHNIDTLLDAERFMKNGHAPFLDRKSTRLNSSHIQKSRMPSSA